MFINCIRRMWFKELPPILKYTLLVLMNQANLDKCLNDSSKKLKLKFAYYTITIIICLVVINIRVSMSECNNVHCSNAHCPKIKVDTSIL